MLKKQFVLGKKISNSPYAVWTVFVIYFA